jgi:hypothetical protein
MRHLSGHIIIEGALPAHDNSPKKETAVQGRHCEEPQATKQSLSEKVSSPRRKPTVDH